MSADTVVCPFDPTKECTCASKSFSLDMFTEVVTGLMQRYEISETEAIAEYKKGDMILRQLYSPDKVVNDCLYSTIGKIRVRKKD